jgi:hypothetical protein
VEREELKRLTEDGPAHPGRGQGRCSVVALSLLYLAPLVVSAVHRARKGVGGGL